MSYDIVERYKQNPIITLIDIPFPCNTVFNAGATMYKDKYILLLRVETLSGRSVFVLAESHDGIHFSIQKKPVMFPSNEEPFKTYEKRGIEDPRITKIDDTYYIVYTAYSEHSPRLAIAKTKDFVKFERMGLISEPDNKDAALFPEKFNGYYVRLDRPVTSSRANMWISYSKDLIYWGNAKAVMTTRPGYWDGDRLGAGATPFRTTKGWLEIYHGVKNTASGSIYRLGCALFDLNDPSKLIGRSSRPILSPFEFYERVGDVPNVVFTCGVIVNYDKDEEGKIDHDRGVVNIYYGAADTSICLGWVRIEDLLRSVGRED